MNTPPARTQAALDSRRRTVEDMLDRVRTAITTMTRDQAAISVQAISRRAGVSRAFLYQNVQARTLVAEGLKDAAEHREQSHQAAAQATELAWRERAFNAEDALKATHNEIRRQRDQIAELLGRVRDLESDLPAEAAQRLATENTTLKDQNSKQAKQIKTLTDRLNASRGNTHSLEKRLSELQAELLDPTQGRHLHAVAAITGHGQDPSQ